MDRKFKLAKMGRGEMTKEVDKRTKKNQGVSEIREGVDRTG